MEIVIASIEPQPVRELVQALPVLAQQRVLQLWNLMSICPELPAVQRFKLICSSTTGLLAARHCPWLWESLEFHCAATTQRRSAAEHLQQFGAALSSRYNTVATLKIALPEQLPPDEAEGLVQALRCVLDALEGSPTLAALDLVSQDIDWPYELGFDGAWLQLPALRRLGYGIYGSVLTGSLSHLHQLEELATTDCDLAAGLQLPASLTRLAGSASNLYPYPIVVALPGGLPQLQDLSIAAADSLELQAGNYNDLDVSALGSLMALTSLKLNGGGGAWPGYKLLTSLPGQAPLEGLLALKSLAKLDLSYVHVEGGRVLDMSGMEGLEEVSIFECNLPGFTFRGPGLRKLRSVHISCDDPGDPNIPFLEFIDLPALQVLKVADVRVATLCIGGLPQLQEIGVKQCRLNGGYRMEERWEARSITVEGLPNNLKANIAFNNFFTEDGPECSASVIGRVE